jgi:hypothetical protein
MKARRPSPTKRCAALGCGTGISTRMLMCITHWRMVPRKIQDEVYSTCAAMLDDGPMRPYVLATQRAVLAVALRTSAQVSAVDAIKAEIARLEAPRV